MYVSSRELRNDTAKVIAAVEAGTPVTLTPHRRPRGPAVPPGRGLSLPAGERLDLGLGVQALLAFARSTRRPRRGPDGRRG